MKTLAQRTQTELRAFPVYKPTKRPFRAPSQSDRRRHPTPNHRDPVGGEAVPSHQTQPQTPSTAERGPGDVPSSLVKKSRAPALWRVESWCVQRGTAIVQQYGRMVQRPSWPTHVDSKLYYNKLSYPTGAKLYYDKPKLF